MRALIIASAVSSGQRCRRGGPAVIPTAPLGGTEPNLGPLHPPARRGRVAEHICKEISFFFFCGNGIPPLPEQRYLHGAGANSCRRWSLKEGDDGCWASRQRLHHGELNRSRARSTESAELRKDTRGEGGNYPGRPWVGFAPQHGLAVRKTMIEEFAY